MRLIPKIFRRKKTRREPVDEPDYAEDHRMSPVPSAHILPESEFGMEMGGVHDPEDDDSPENHAGVGTASHRDLDRVTEVDYNHGRQHEPPRERDTRSYRRRREDDYGRRRSRSRSRSKGRNRTRKLVIPDIVVHPPSIQNFGDQPRSASPQPIPVPPPSSHERDSRDVHSRDYAYSERRKDRGSVKDRNRNRDRDRDKDREMDKTRDTDDPHYSARMMTAGHVQDREIHIEPSAPRDGLIELPHCSRKSRKLHSMEHPQFQYSRCTGRRKGLCIGVNYIGQNSELHGCINDAKEAYQFIIDKYHYDQADVMLLTDDAEDERNLPTRENIVSAMHWLLEGAQMHDSLFIHYSGHGGWSKDRNRDKGYGFDEMIFPVDYKKAGTILDDDLHDYLVGPLPPGCRLTAVFDSCHSASVLDLTYRYHSDGHAKRLRLSSRFLDERSTPGDVLCWSGSKDDQDSADASVGGLSVGAMSYAFLKVLKSKPDITYEDLLRGLRRETKKYQQKPQLSASHRMDIDRKFVM